MQPPRWLFDAVGDFAGAAQLSASGDVATARAALVTPQEPAARHWFVEHAQVSSHHRRRVLQVPRPGEPLRERRASTPLAVRQRVWERDGYTCRYCGLPTIPAAMREALQRVVGSDVLPWGSTNASRHGVALCARTEYDHVLPASLGGADDDSNLVAACAACNYGKGRWTVAELGIEDPRLRPPVATDWDGLTSLLSLLAAR